MKLTPQKITAKVTNAKGLNVIGPGLKRWRRKLLYCLLLIVVPAVLVSPLAEARSNEEKKAERNGDKRGATAQSQRAFRLPHQASFLVSFAGNDDCPGKPIPAGTYTASSPYTDSGDTTGANDTITGLLYNYWDFTEARGLDHIYSFTLTSRGANPEITASGFNSTTPFLYVLDHRFDGCPAGTRNIVHEAVAESGALTPGTAIIPSEWMATLPLNVPLYLGVEFSPFSGPGAYTIRMQDVTIAQSTDASLIDSRQFFVRQHYLDFLNREPDTDGLIFWTTDMTSCGTDAQCAEVKRINVSAAFFLSIEFQQTGYLVYKAYATAFGQRRIGWNVPLTRSEFLPDVQRVGQGVVVGAASWKEQLEANQTAYFNEFVQRPNFVATYPPTMDNSQFVDALNTNAGSVLTPSVRDQLVNELSSGARTRAQVLRAVVNNETFNHAQFNRAFVLMQYFGYLRRNPNDAPDGNFDGYNFWLAKLDQFNGNFIEAEMVKAFLTSTEYRQRFGQPQVRPPLRKSVASIRFINFTMHEISTEVASLLQPYTIP
jgi:hypothetical protein